MSRKCSGVFRNNLLRIGPLLLDPLYSFCSHVLLHLPSLSDIHCLNPRKTLTTSTLISGLDVSLVLVFYDVNTVSFMISHHEHSFTFPSKA